MISSSGGCGLLAAGCTAIFLLSPSTVWAEPTVTDSKLTPELERAIEQYIRSHPEVIEQSLQALEINGRRRKRPDRRRPSANGSKTCFAIQARR